MVNENKQFTEVNKPVEAPVNSAQERQDNARQPEQQPVQNDSLQLDQQEGNLEHGETGMDLRQKEEAK